MHYLIKHEVTPRAKHTCLIITITKLGIKGHAVNGVLPWTSIFVNLPRFLNKTRMSKISSENIGATLS